MATVRNGHSLKKLKRWRNYKEHKRKINWNLTAGTTFTPSKCQQKRKLLFDLSKLFSVKKENIKISFY